MIVKLCCKERTLKIRPYSSNNINIINNNNNINTNTNNSNTDLNNINNKTSNNFNNIPRKFKKKIPESTLFNEIAQERIKLEKERKNDLWKKELLEQIKEKRRREEKSKIELEEQEKKDILENEKYMKMKKKQKEEHNKKIREEQEKKIREKIQNNQSQSVGNILDISNNLEQGNKSIMSNNNITFREGNLNDISQNLNNENIEENNNIDINNNIIENNNINNLDNNYNNYNNIQIQTYYPNQENFKNEINRQYHLLNETLNHDIDLEMKRISKDLENNYSPFTQKLLLMNTYSKSRSDLGMEQKKKIKKIENMIEDKKLVDYILGNRLRPPTPKDDFENIQMPIPSYFGTNRDKAENKYLGLHSKSSFINKGENISNFIASGRNQDVISINNESNLENNLDRKNDINNMYNFAMKNDIDLNYINNYYNNNNKLNQNSVKSTFGTNIINDESLGGVVNTAQNLDNISVFIPLNKDRENINLYNEKKIGQNFYNENKIRDKDMESMFKDLDKIYELTNKIDVSSKAKNISAKFDENLNIIKNKENTLNKYFENICKDKITEEPSKHSSTNPKKTTYSRDDDENKKVLILIKQKK